MEFTRCNLVHERLTPRLSPRPPSLSTTDSWLVLMHEARIQREITCLPVVDHEHTGLELAAMLHTDDCLSWCHGYVINVVNGTVLIDCDCNARALQR